MAREGGGRTTRKTILGLEELSANRQGADVWMATVIAAKGICPIAPYPALSTQYAAYACVGGLKGRDDRPCGGIFAQHHHLGEI